MFVHFECMLFIYSSRKCALIVIQVFFLIKSIAGNRDCIVMKLINSDTFGWQHSWEIFFGKKVIFVGLAAISMSPSLMWIIAIEFKVVKS